METDIKLTKISKCAGCGAKVGAGVLASMGFIPAGAYRNREFVTGNICVAPKIPLPLEDILYDPQTSGGLLISIPESDADSLLEELRSAEVDAFIVGSVTPPDVFSLYVQ